MKKNKIFVACDSKKISKIKKIISETQNSKIKVGYKFGLEFLNSKNGRNFVSKLITYILEILSSKNIIRIKKELIKKFLLKIV